MDKIKVACVGDSLTWGYMTDNQPWDNYPAVLGRLLGEKYDVGNFGDNGRTLSKETDYSYWDFEGFQQVSQWLPDWVIIMLGTNDTKPSKWQGEAHYEQQYQNLIDHFKNLSKQPTIVLNTIPTAFYLENAMTYDLLEAALQAVPKIIKKVGKANGLRVIDVHEATQGHPDLFPEDGVHTSTAGARFIAETVYEGLSSIEKSNTDLFSKKATQYAKGRPGYPTSVLTYLTSLLDENPVFADIGAGTGKLTEVIAKGGYQVFAVEPNPDMFGQLEQVLRPYGNATPVFATSEATTLPDHSVDMITVAQALHWFDLEAFTKECKRILKPGGWVVALYNNAKAEANSQQTHRTLATEKFFPHPIIQHFTHQVPYNQEEWLAYHQSHSHNPLPNDPNFDGHMLKASQYFDENAEDGTLFYEMVTVTYAQPLKDLK
ncbi:MAG: GDSL-type esterase/lipase family protein [Turicibacter sp.]|nr:GDSL-type esterase/lipase family protein [Turicibacter sp.]